MQTGERRGVARRGGEKIISRETSSEGRIQKQIIFSGNYPAPVAAQKGWAN